MAAPGFEYPPSESSEDSDGGCAQPPCPPFAFGNVTRRHHRLEQDGRYDREVRESLDEVGSTTCVAAPMRIDQKTRIACGWRLAGCGCRACLACGALQQVAAVCSCRYGATAKAELGVGPDDEKGAAAAAREAGQLEISRGSSASSSDDESAGCAAEKQDDPAAAERPSHALRNAPMDVASATGVAVGWFRGQSQARRDQLLSGGRLGGDSSEDYDGDTDDAEEHVGGVDTRVDAVGLTKRRRDVEASEDSFAKVARAMDEGATEEAVVGLPLPATSNNADTTNWETDIQW
jgi:hypothetical protein